MTLYRLIILLTIFSITVSCSIGDSLRLSVSDEEDDGIGGTGRTMATNVPNTYLSGHITAFGSIYVNGVHVKYNKNTVIQVDGVNRPAYQFSIGEVAGIQARKNRKGAFGFHINISHEVIGRVTSIDKQSRSIKILGQTIFVASGQAHYPAIGQWTKVSGYTNHQGQIFATHLKKAKPGLSLLNGYVRKIKGNYHVRGVQVLSNRHTRLRTGQYVILEGIYRNRRLKLSRVRNIKPIASIKSIRKIIARGFIIRLPNGSYSIANLELTLSSHIDKTFLGKPVYLEMIKNSLGKYVVRNIKVHDTADHSMPARRARFEVPEVGHEKPDMSIEKPEIIKPDGDIRDRDRSRP